MRFLVKVSVLFLVCAALSVPPAGASHFRGVEIFISAISYTLPLPGTPAGPGIDFTGNKVITSLDFTPGSVTFAGQPIDFDGTEADFIANSYSHDLNFPVNSGPATITATGTGSIAGTTNFSGDLIWDGLDLGAGFSNSNLDLDLGSSFSSNLTGSNWNSTVIPELNGQTVSIRSEESIAAVDPINGIFQTNGSGEILVEFITIPAVTVWGVILLATGLAGLGILYTYRNRGVNQAG